MQSSSWKQGLALKNAAYGKHVSEIADTDGIPLASGLCLGLFASSLAGGNGATVVEEVLCLASKYPTGQHHPVHNPWALPNTL